jgi:hypothetical protein
MALPTRLLCQAQAAPLRDWHTIAGFSEHYYMDLRCILSQHSCVAVLLKEPYANSTNIKINEGDTLHRGRLTRLWQNIAVVIVDNIEFPSVSFILPMSS